MLTATYSFVAIVAEQQLACDRLQRAQQYVHAGRKGSQRIDFNFLDTAFNKLRQFDQYCRNRKLETCLIPALRNSSGEADALIAELDGLSAAGLDILRSVGDQMATALFEHTHFAGLCQAMERYCAKLFIRLDREEQVLLPMARRLLSTEAWFSIAAQLLSDDAHANGRGRRRAMMLHQGRQSAGVTMNARMH